MASEITKTASIKALHAEGKSVAEISKALGIKYQFAYNVLKQANLVVVVRDKQDTKTAKILAMHAEGKSITEISKALEIRFQHVYNVLRSKQVISSKR